MGLLGLAVLVGASLASFHPLDPFPGQLANISGPVHNWIGLTGASIAWVLFGALGLASLWVPALLAWWAVRLFGRRASRSNLAVGVGLALLIPASAGLLTLAHPRLIWAAEPLATGGWVGGILAALLQSWLKTLGAALILAGLALVGLMLSTDLSLASVIEAARNQGGSFFSRLATARIRVKEKRERDRSPRFARLKKKLVERPSPVKIEIPQPPPARSVQEGFTFMTQGGGFELPSLSLLDDPPAERVRVDEKNLEMNSRLLEKKLFDFGVEGEVQAVQPGPVITMYEFAPAPGVKISRVVNLADDLALALRAAAIRIVAPLPGKGRIGIEIPNPKRETVSLKDILSGAEFKEYKGHLPLVLGKDITGQTCLADLARMPHLLIAGATGSGKSVCLNTILISLLFRSGPEEIKLLMVDPKRIELSLYDGIPHLLHPVLIDPKSATKALRWAVREMEGRYDILAQANVRSIEAYNNRRRKKAAPRTEPAVDVDGGELPERLPYIVIVIDELADLMMISSREVEESITRLAQMARAAGIHLILATQRPSVDVITGVIKANFPARIAFQVASKIDSRTILDQNGAENLLGLGDMLFLPPGVGKLVRVHGAFVTDAEVKRVTDFVRGQGQPEYDSSILEAGGSEGSNDILDEEEDERYQDAVRLVLDSGKASISMIQRKLRIGYNRAARMIERMAAEGIVSEPDHTNTRRVLTGAPEEVSQ